MKGSSILVVCPEILESLHLLRSSLCAAILARVDFYAPSIQIILLTPTDNLAKTHYRLLKGYARFCNKIGARICLDDGDPDPDECFHSPMQSAGSRKVVDNILVGTPKAVLVQLKAVGKTRCHIAMMVICHAQDIFENFQHTQTLTELSQGLHVSQVSSTVTCSCKQLVRHIYVLLFT